MPKRLPMSPTQKEVARRGKLIDRWKSQQREIKRTAEVECDILQRRIDRETVLVDAIERGALRP